MKTLLGFSVTLFAACMTTTEPTPIDPISPTGSDAGTPAAMLNGIVEIDNAIANATVYIDYNHNNVLDDGEPSVVTDATGHFSIAWDNPDLLGAIVGSDATRVGATGSNAAVGLAIHMRAPAPALGTAAVISPLTTLVASELDWDPSLSESAADAKLAGALAASQLPFVVKPVGVMGDYATAAATSSDSAQLRFVASAVAATIASAVKAGNAAQSDVDCDDPMIFTPAIVAMDTQLTAIADAVYKFSQLPAAQQAAIQQSSASYQNYFLNATNLATTIENELEAAAEDFAADLFEEIADAFVAQLEDQLVEMVADEIIGAILTGG